MTNASGGILKTKTVGSAEETRRIHMAWGLETALMAHSSKPKVQCGHLQSHLSGVVNLQERAPPMAKRRKKTIVWLTRVEIQAAASESPEAALACSIAHWRQLKAATAVELREGFNRHAGLTDSQYCALCHRNRHDSECPTCPLKDKINVCCSEYHDADELCDDWRNGEVSIAPFRAAAGKLIAKMVGIQRSKT